jgi:hypothetical protein
VLVLVQSWMGTQAVQPRSTREMYDRGDVAQQLKQQGVGGLASGLATRVEVQGGVVFVHRAVVGL